MSKDMLETIRDMAQKTIDQPPSFLTSSYSITMHPNLWIQYTIDQDNQYSINELSRLYLDKTFRAMKEKNLKSQYPIQWHRIILIVKRGGYLNLHSNNGDYSNYGSVRYLGGTNYELKYNGSNPVFFDSAPSLIQYIKGNPRALGFGYRSYIWE